MLGKTIFGTLLSLLKCSLWVVFLLMETSLFAMEHQSYQDSPLFAVQMPISQSFSDEDDVDGNEGTSSLKRARQTKIDDEDMGEPTVKKQKTLEDTTFSKSIFQQLVHSGEEEDTEKAAEQLARLLIVKNSWAREILNTFVESDDINENNVAYFCLGNLVNAGDEGVAAVAADIFSFLLKHENGSIRKLAEEIINQADEDRVEGLPLMLAKFSDADKATITRCVSEQTVDVIMYHLAIEGDKWAIKKYMSSSKSICYFMGLSVSEVKDSLPNTFVSCYDDLNYQKTMRNVFLYCLVENTLYRREECKGITVEMVVFSSLIEKNDP